MKGYRQPKEHEDYPEIKEALTKAFRELRKVGFLARQNFQDCQSCALELIPLDKDRFVFYHHQDNTSLIRTGKVYLSWGGDANVIIDTLKKQGLHTEWDNNKDTRILVSLLN